MRDPLLFAKLEMLVSGMRKSGLKSVPIEREYLEQIVEDVKDLTSENRLFKAEEECRRLQGELEKTIRGLKALQEGDVVEESVAVVQTVARTSRRLRRVARGADMAAPGGDVSVIATRS